MPKIVEKFDLANNVFATAPFVGVIEVHAYRLDGSLHWTLSRWEVVSASLNGEPVADLVKLMRDNEKVLHWTAESFLP